jgi:pimeloyl-ACP methyl ester carboxylesterase
MTSYSWRAGYADSPLGQIHYLMSAPRGRGDAVVLLNPRSRSCRALLPFLAPRHPLFVVDIPGFGASSPPPAGATMPKIGAAVAALMEALAVPAAHLYGIHTGGKVAAALALGHPAKALSLIVCGKTHSIIADHAARNAAMRAQLDSGKPDAMLMKLEGKYIDDAEGAQGGARIYEANFAFDLAAALARTEVRTLILEITSEDEDRKHGRHGAALAAKAKRAIARTVPQIEAAGIDLYVGTGVMAEIILAFAAGRLGDGTS